MRTGEVVLPLLGLLALAADAGPASGAWRNSLAPEGPRAHSLTLARDGRTDYVVVIPAAVTPQERKAAQDLALWLGQMTDAQFRVIPDSVPPIDTEISVGQTNRLRRADLPHKAAELGDEGYAIGVQGRRLFLWGGRKRGPIYAVYALLEEDLGCRWYAGQSSRIPHLPTLRFRPAPRAYVPPFFIRDPFYKDAFDATWSLRNRTNAPGAAVPEEWGGHVDYDGLFVHTFNILVPPAQYFGEHPEYYALIDGARRTQQLCLSNPEVLRIATESVLRALREHPHAEIIEVSPNDGGGHCACPDCARLDEENASPSGSLLNFVNQIAQVVEQEHPGVLVSTLAYLDTVDPPRVLRARDNVIVRLCNDLHAWRYPLSDFVSADHPESRRYREAIIGWSQRAANLSIWDYTVNYSHYLAPMPNLHLLAPSVHFYLAHNVKGIMFQGNYQSVGGERTPLRIWVMAKLLWDPSRSVEELVQDFVWGYYEEAAPAIAEYYELLDQARRARGAALDEETQGIRYTMRAPFLSSEFLERATAALDRALALAQSDEVRRRVQLERLPIIYVKLSRGPEFTGAAQYRALLVEFEEIAHREKITHLSEGEPDLEVKVKRWREALEQAAAR